MKQLNEFLSTKVKIKKSTFPKEPIEKDIIAFLNNQHFKTFKIDWTQYNVHNKANVIFNLIAKEYNYDQCYFFQKTNGSIFNEIFLFNGGVVSKDNPIFNILVYPEKNKIDNGFFAGTARYDGEYYTEYNRCTTDKHYPAKNYNDLVNDINEVFNW